MAQLTLSIKEQEMLKKWQKKHKKHCRTYKDTKQLPTLKYILISNGIGMSIKVKCACGDKKDITDLSSW